MKAVFLAVGYVYIAGLLWNLVRRASIPGPWEGVAGGYPRAIALFPYYLPLYIVVSALSCSDALGKIGRNAKKGLPQELIELLEKIAVTVAFAGMILAEMLGLVDDEEE